MDLANHEQEYHHQSHGQGPNNNRGGSGLLRFRSAPSSLFASACENLDSEERLLTSVLMNGNDDHLSFPEYEDKPSLIQLAGGGGGAATRRISSTSCSSEIPQLMSPPSPAKIGRSGLLPPQYPRQNNNSMRSSGLSRQSSSPAGFFSYFNMPNGYGPVGGMGGFRMGTGTPGEVCPSPNGMNEPVSFASRVPSSSLGSLSRISEVGDEGIDLHSPTSGQQKHGSSDVPFFRSGYPVNSWDNSAQILENNENSQNEQAGSRPRILSHHLSLPKSMEMSTMEKLIQFPDSVPCKIRAKRGCATHPRSIAERVRRTRISERMRKLQELVPNMDKQTNTSDMLDLAVDYIKDLQRQFRMLSDKRANCKCASKLLIPKQP